MLIMSRNKRMFRAHGDRHQVVDTQEHYDQARLDRLVEYCCCFTHPLRAQVDVICKEEVVYNRCTSGDVLFCGPLLHAYRLFKCCCCRLMVMMMLVVDLVVVGCAKSLSVLSERR